MSAGKVSPATRAWVEETRLAHNALWRGKRWLPPWRWLKSHETARAYRYALFAAALEELAATPSDPALAAEEAATRQARDEHEAEKDADWWGGESRG